MRSSTSLPCRICCTLRARSSASSGASRGPGYAQGGLMLIRAQEHVLEREGLADVLRHVPVSDLPDGYPWTHVEVISEARSRSSRSSRTLASWTSARPGVQRYSFRTERIRVFPSRSHRRRTCAGRSGVRTIVAPSSSRARTTRPQAAADSITTVPIPFACRPGNLRHHQRGEDALPSHPHAVTFSGFQVDSHCWTHCSGLEPDVGLSSLSLFL